MRAVAGREVVRVAGRGRVGVGVSEAGKYLCNGAALLGPHSGEDVAAWTSASVDVVKVDLKAASVE